MEVKLYSVHQTVVTIVCVNWNFFVKRVFNELVLLQARLWSSRFWSSQSVRSPTSTKTIFEKFTSSVRIPPFQVR